MFSLCHNLPFLHTITTPHHPYSYSCPPQDNLHHCLCASPGNTNHASCPVDVHGPWEMVMIVGNAIDHCSFLELVTGHMENGIAPTPATMTAGGCTLNFSISLTAISPGAQCAQSMGHTLPLHWQCRCTPTSMLNMILCTCRITCSSAALWKMLIGYFTMWKSTMRTCGQTTPVSRKKTLN